MQWKSGRKREELPKDKREGLRNQDSTGMSRRQQEKVTGCMENQKQSRSRGNDPRQKGEGRREAAPHGESVPEQGMNQGLERLPQEEVPEKFNSTWELVQERVKRYLNHGQQVKRSLGPKGPPNPAPKKAHRREDKVVH